MQLILNGDQSEMNHFLSFARRRAVHNDDFEKMFGFKRFSNLEYL